MCQHVQGLFVCAACFFVSWGLWGSGHKDRLDTPTIIMLMKVGGVCVCSEGVNTLFKCYVSAA